jgi:hypothetical protein
MPFSAVNGDPSSERPGVKVQNLNFLVDHDLEVREELAGFSVVDAFCLTAAERRRVSGSSWLASAMTWMVVMGSALGTPGLMSDPSLKKRRRAGRRPTQLGEWQCG